MEKEGIWYDSARERGNFDVDFPNEFPTEELVTPTKKSQKEDSTPTPNHKNRRKNSKAHAKTPSKEMTTKGGRPTMQLGGRFATPSPKKK